MPLSTIHNAFVSAGTHSLAVIQAANAVDAGGTYTHPPDVRQTIVEAAVLKYFVAWEMLLEESFTAFLLGETSTNGTVWAKYASPRDSLHAGQILKGVQVFTDWGTPDKVLMLARAYFVNAGPFENAINSIMSDWTDFKTIRNAAAHLSSNTAHKLDGLASRRLGTPTAGITVERFVLSTDPRAAPNTIFDSLQAVFTGASLIITT